LKAFSWESLSRSLNVFSMKNYLADLGQAFDNHLRFLHDNMGVALASVCVGLGIWLLEFVELYIFADFKYLLYLLIMMVANAISGISRQNFLSRTDPVLYPRPTARVFREKTFSKLVYYIVTLTSIHGIAHFNIKGDEVTLFHGLEYAALVTMIATEFYSIQENYAIQGKKTILSVVWDKVKDYVPSKKKPEL
jgi:magnesium-transporting ATPase (P-type)